MRPIAATFAALAVLLATALPARAGFIATLKPYGTGGAFPGLIEGNEYVVRIDWTQNQAGGHDAPWITHEFSSFCIERSQVVYFGSTYDFATRALDNSPDSNVVGSQGMGSAKAIQLRRLWAIEIDGDGHGGVNQLGADNSRNAAFQQAVWGILDSSYLTGTQYTSYTPDAVKTLVSAYIAESNTAGVGANLVALTGAGFQDQIVELGPGYYLEGNGNIVAAPAPHGLVLVLTGVMSLLGLRRFFRPAA